MMLNRVARAISRPVANKVATKMAVGAAALTPAAYYAARRPFVKAQTAVDQNQHGGLDPNNFVPLRLSEVQPISPDTAIYYFQLSGPDAQLNMPTTSYVLAKADVNGEPVVRPYTPISELPGEMPLVVKTYPNGKLGNVFSNLSVGDTMLFKGPLPKFQYRENEFDRLTLIAGGTGITPMFQLIERIMLNENDNTQVHLLFANRSTDDILMKAILDEFEYSFPDRFKVTYVIDQPEEGWKGPTGYINADLLNAVAGEPNPKHKVFVCGPPGMMEAISGPKGPNYTQGELKGLLKNLGYTESDVFKFLKTKKKFFKKLHCR
eukprot:UN04766